MSILKTYDNICRYNIHKPIQPLDLDCDVDAIKAEALKIISTDNYGFKSLILTLPPGQTNWHEAHEDVQYAGVNVCGEDYSEIKWNDRTQLTFSDGTDYTEWHDQAKLIRNFKTQLENYSGLRITKVRLVWMEPDYAYPMHCDYEPIRFHVPLLTNPYCYFIHGKELYTMPYGKAYHIITDDIHTATNYGLYPRLHLIYSTYSDEDMNQKLRTQVHEKIKNSDVYYKDQKDLDYLIKIAQDWNRKDLVKIYESHKKINTRDEKDGH